VLCACGGRKATDDGSVESYWADFSSPEEMNNWKCYDSGKWEIRDGWLVCDARQTSSTRSILWLSRILPPSVQLEFEAECLDKPGEILCFLGGDGQSYSGYEITVGGQGNKRVAVYKSAKDGDESAHERLGRENFKLDRERAYAIKLRKYRGSFRVYVNGDLLVSVSDEKPIEDSAHRYFGFSTVGNLVRFDNLKIERKF